MSVSNRNSMNTLRPSNEVVNRLNERSSGFARAGEISRNETGVEFAGLSDIIEYYWFRDKKREYTNRDIAEVKEEVKEIFNSVVDSDPDFYYTRHLDFKMLMIMFWLVMNKNVSPTRAGHILRYFVETRQINKIKLRAIRNKLFEQLETLEY